MESNSGFPKNWYTEKDQNSLFKLRHVLILLKRILDELKLKIENTPGVMVETSDEKNSRLTFRDEDEKTGEEKN